MARPHIAPSAYKRGVTFHDVDAVLRFPEKVMRLSDTHTGQPERPNVDTFRKATMRWAVPIHEFIQLHFV